MSLVTISNVQLLNNPGRFTDTIEFEITFESLADLEQGTAASHLWSPALSSLVSRLSRLTPAVFHLLLAYTHTFPLPRP